jgi:hypothetical protein
MENEQTSYEDRLWKPCVYHFADQIKNILGLNLHVDMYDNATIRKETLDPHPALVKINKTQFPFIWGDLKKISKHYGIPLTTLQEIYFRNGNRLIPVLIDLGCKQGLDPVESCQHYNDMIVQQLLTAINNDDTRIQLQINKDKIYVDQQNMITVVPE